MKERPINLKAHEVLAILDGRKTQLRRVVKPQPSIRCPFGKAGDRLWVRETFAIVPRTAYRASEGVQQTLRPGDDHDAAIYRAGWTRSNGGFRWRPSIHMPRWAGRIMLEVVSIKVQRLHDISEEDAFSEGIERIEEHSWSAKGAAPLGTFRGMDEWSDAEPFWTDATDAYRSLWEIEHGLDSWNANPWVWVIEFKCIDKKGGAE